MKKLASIALAGLIGIASLASGTMTAAADSKRHWNKPRPPAPYARPYHHRHRPGPGPAAGFAAGTVLGLTFGALATAPGVYYAPHYYYPPPPPPVRYPRYSRSEAHMEWCLDRYRSYNPATNTYRGFDGFDHVCVSPY